MVETKNPINSFVSSPYIDGIHSLFDRLRENNKQFGKVDCALITGESGAGKSEIIKQYCQKYPLVQTIEKDTLPVLRVSFKKTNSDERLLQFILRAMKKPPSRKSNESYEDLLQEIVLTAKGLELEILFLDEVQRIMQQRSRHVVQSINDTLKELIDALNIPIVFIGMPWLKDMIVSSSQLDERIVYERPLLHYPLTTKAFKDFAILLKKLVAAYGFEDEINPSKKDIVWRFYAYSAGIMRRTSNLFKSAYILRQSGNQKKGLNLFADVFEDTKKQGYFKGLSKILTDKKEKKSDDTSHVNPFLALLTELELYEMAVREDFKFGSNAFKNRIGKTQYNVWGISSDNKLCFERTESIAR